MARFATSPTNIRTLNFSSLTTMCPCLLSLKVQKSLRTKFDRMETSMATTLASM